MSPQLWPPKGDQHHTKQVVQEEHLTQVVMAREGKGTKEDKSTQQGLLQRLRCRQGRQCQVPSGHAHLVVLVALAPTKCHHRQGQQPVALPMLSGSKGFNQVVNNNQQVMTKVVDKQAKEEATSAICRPLHNSFLNHKVPRQQLHNSTKEVIQAEAVAKDMEDHPKEATQMVEQAKASAAQCVSPHTKKAAEADTKEDQRAELEPQQGNA